MKHKGHMHSGSKKTKIVTSQKANSAAKRKKSFKKMSKEVKRTHKGYGMKSIEKGNFTFKKTGKKKSHKR